MHRVKYRNSPNFLVWKFCGNAQFPQSCLINVTRSHLVMLFFGRNLFMILLLAHFKRAPVEYDPNFIQMQFKFHDFSSQRLCLFFLSIHVQLVSSFVSQRLRIVKALILQKYVKLIRVYFYMS